MAVFVVRTERRPGVIRFVVRYQAGRYSPQVHLGSFKTSTEANLRRQAAERAVAAGLDPAMIGKPVQRRPLSVVVDEFLDARRANAAPNTIEALQYRSVPVKKLLGHLNVHDVSPADVQAMILELKDRGATGEKGEANRTIRNRISLLRQVLDFAGVDPNPVDARMVVKPKNTGRRILVPTPAEEAAILPLMAMPHRAVVEWIGATGMRISEVAALAWSDVFPDQQAVRVLESKTTAGERWIKSDPLAPFDVPVRPDGAPDYGRVFDASRGAVQAGIARACEQAGVRRLGPHSWRHLHASVCIRNGMDVVRVAARLGHGSPDITLRVYAHLIEPR